MSGFLDECEQQLAEDRGIEPLDARELVALVRTLGDALAHADAALEVAFTTMGQGTQDERDNAFRCGVVMEAALAAYRDATGEDA